MKSDLSIFKRARLRYNHIKFRFYLKFQKHTRSLNVCMKRQALDKDYSVTDYNLLVNKVIGKNFVQSLGISIPRTFQAFSTLHNVNLKSHTVLKPSFEAWSRGVFLIKNDHDIIDLTDNGQLFSFEEIFHKAKIYLEQKVVKMDSWNVEELIVDEEGRVPPGDINFFCFYGEIGLILEKVFNPEKKSHFKIFYDGRGVQISPQIWEKKKMNGQPPLQEYFDVAKEISTRIPVPFIRIDFLKSKDGPIFSEFELRPGNLERLFHKYDKILGTLYLSAKKRLDQDLANNKKFISPEDLPHFIKFKN